MNKKYEPRTPEPQENAKRKNAKRKIAEKRGRRAETLAALYLQLKGYHILAQRERTPFGEIDILARRRKILVVVEVKARQSAAQAHSSITPSAQRRIERAGAFVQSRAKPLQALSMRFDTIFLIKGWRLQHQKDAWRPY